MALNKPVAIISVNNNPDYLFTLPIVLQSWNIQGWHVEVILVDVSNECLNMLEYYTDHLSVYYSGAHDIPLSKINKALFTQLARLYWPMQVYEPYDNTYCIMTDADMFIASSFLNRDFDKVNVFGHDLTGYSQIPMCYVGAPASKWHVIMDNFGMANDLRNYAKANSNDWFVAWGADQDILTAKINRYTGLNSNNTINKIKRGTDALNAGLPLGRLDRHNWQYPKGEIHDCHLMRNGWHDANYERLNEMVHTIYPKEDWGWLPAYKREFKKLFNYDNQ